MDEEINALKKRIDNTEFIISYYLIRLRAAKWIVATLVAFIALLIAIIIQNHTDVTAAQDEVNDLTVKLETLNTQTNALKDALPAKDWESELQANIISLNQETHDALETAEINFNDSIKNYHGDAELYSKKLRDELTEKLSADHDANSASRRA